MQLLCFLLVAEALEGWTVLWIPSLHQLLRKEGKLQHRPSFLLAALTLSHQFHSSDLNQLGWTVQLHNQPLRRKKDSFWRTSLLGGMNNCSVGASISEGASQSPQWKISSWWRQVETGQVTKRVTKWFFSLERSERTSSQWTTVIQYQLFKLSQFVWAVSTPK